MAWRYLGVAWDGQPWRTAKSITTLGKQLEQARGGSMPTDGTVAGKAHDQRSPTSDHTVRPTTGSGIVYAIDIGLRPGWNHSGFIDSITKSRDVRLRYLIHGKRIFKTYPSNGKPAYTWHPYTLGGHDNHIHISVDKTRAARYDDPTPWVIGGSTAPRPPGDDVEQVYKDLQQGLKDAGYYTGAIDGKWGTNSKAAYSAMCKDAKKTGGGAHTHALTVSGTTKVGG